MKKVLNVHLSLSLFHVEDVLKVSSVWIASRGVLPEWKCHKA